MAGSKSRSKGYRGEKEIRDKFEDNDCDVTWHNEDPDKPDLSVQNYTCEVKYGRGVPKKIYKILDQDGADLFAVRRVANDCRGKAWVIGMRFELFMELLRKSEVTRYCVQCGEKIPTTLKHFNKNGNYCKECNLEDREIGRQNDH